MEIITRSQLRADANEARKKKKKSLRRYLGLPIGSVLFSAPQFSSYDGGGEGEAGGIEEMIQVAKDVQKKIDKSGKGYEVFDVECDDELTEAGIGASGAQFEVDTTDLQVKEDSLADPKDAYKVHVKDPNSNKMIIIEYSDPNLAVKNPKKEKSAYSRLTPREKDEEGQGTNYRGWSAKYWQDKPIKEMISEIINPDEVEITSLKFNDELSPLLWNGEELKPEVRDSLLKTAIEFIKFCGIEKYRYKDIVFVGSMANYNYTPQSDIDLHIVVDFQQFKATDEFIGEYFSAKKDIWNDTHNITIKDHAVECYVQKSTEPNASIGIYSLVKNEWVREPIKKFVTVDETNIQLKSAEYMNAIDKLEIKFKNGEDVVEATSKIKEKIKNMRKSGLYKEGEYSTENLVFKVLRNSGYLEKLINLKNNNMDQNLSI